MALRTDSPVSWVKIAAAVLIVLVWSTLMLADAFSQSFTAPPEALAPMLLAASYLFGIELKKASSNGGGK